MEKDPLTPCMARHDPLVNWALGAVRTTQLCIVRAVSSGGFNVQYRYQQDPTYTLADQCWQHKADKKVSQEVAVLLSIYNSLSVMFSSLPR